MDESNIEGEYRDTPEKFRATADEVIAFLVDNLHGLNAEQEKYAEILSRGYADQMSVIRKVTEPDGVLKEDGIKGEVIMKIELDNGKIMVTRDTLLKDIRLLLDDYGFTVTDSHGSTHGIIYHGRIRLDEAEKAVVHLYFDRDTAVMRSAVIHTFPIDFEYVQEYLIRRYGEPDEMLNAQNCVWKLSDGEIKHCIVDRFGDEECIYFEFL